MGNICYISSRLKRGKDFSCNLNFFRQDFTFVSVYSPWENMYQNSCHFTVESHTSILIKYCNYLIINLCSHRAHQAELVENILLYQSIICQLIMMLHTSIFNCSNVTLLDDSVPLLLIKLSGSRGSHWLQGERARFPKQVPVSAPGPYDQPD